MLTRAAALALLLLLPATVSGQEIDTAVSAVVKISGTRGGTPVRGSGFVVGLERDKATIVTASHVIEGVKQIKVIFAVDLNKKSYRAGAVLGMESGNQRGLAVFQVRGALPTGVTALGFETEVPLRQGEEVFLVGFPQMAKSPLTPQRTFDGPDGNFLQLDLPVGEGFSGAPVLRKGKVLGVVVDEDLQLTFAVNALVTRGALVGWRVKLSEQSKQAAPQQGKPAAPLVMRCIPGGERTEAGVVFVRFCPATFVTLTLDKVTLSEFWIGKAKITNEQYRTYRSDHPGDAKLPAEVSQDEAEAACEHFGGRLPSATELAYAVGEGSETVRLHRERELKKTFGEYVLPYAPVLYDVAPFDPQGEWVAKGSEHPNVEEETEASFPFLRRRSGFEFSLPKPGFRCVRPASSMTPTSFAPN